LKPEVCPTDRQYKPALKIADTVYISRFSKSFDHLNISLNFEAKNEPQYIVPALFFPGEINQLNIAPFYW
jgi:hypothetical protein